MNCRAEGWLVGRVFYTLVAAYYWAFTLYLDDIHAKIGDLPNGEWYEHKMGASTYGGRYKFLTHWNLLLQRAYFSLACLAFLIKSNYMRAISRFILGALVLPYCMIVTVVFWLIYSIDRDVIFPKFYEDVYPWWMNHSLHTFCCAITLVDCLVVHNPLPLHLKWERLCLVVTSAFYLSWTFWIRYKGGIWTYSFMYKFTEQQLAMFIISSNVLLFVLHWFGVQLRRLKWGRSVRAQLESDERKNL